MSITSKIALIGASLLAAGAGCAHLLGRRIVLEGTITQLPAPAHGGRMLVSGVFDGQGSRCLVYLGVGPKSIILDQRPGRRGPKRVSFTALRVGQQVRAHIKGGVRETAPAQASAAWMEILR